MFKNLPFYNIVHDTYKTAKIILSTQVRGQNTQFLLYPQPLS